MERKKEIRQHIKRLRRELNLSEWENKTHRIKEKIVSYQQFLAADDIYCYADFGGEVGTRSIIQEAWKFRKRVYVPKVHGDTMDFYEIHSFDELEAGIFGVPEPKDTGRHLPASGEDGLMIVPGVAFDRNCNRIGYGKGYYDRYLALHPQLHTVAVVFDLQVVDRIDAEKTDIRPQLLMTESKCYRKAEN